MDNNTILNVTQAAEIAGVIPYTIRLVLKQGRLKGTKINARAWIITYGNLMQWINNPIMHKTGKKPPIINPT